MSQLESLCTMDRRKVRATRQQQRPSSTLTRAGSTDDIVGRRVSEIPTDFPVHLNVDNPSLVELDLEGTRQAFGGDSTITQLCLETGKEVVSEGARRRLSKKKRGISPQTVTHKSDDEVEPSTIAHMPVKMASSVPVTITTTFEPTSLGEGVDGHRGRISTLSTDSGLGDDHASQTERYSTTSASLNDIRSHPLAMHNMPRHATSDTISLMNSSAARGRVHERHSMLLSDLCVVSVSIAADLYQGQKGQGGALKFRFSPYTQIEYLRVAILKQFHERYSLPVQQLSTLHLCHYLENEEGWEWLEEDQVLDNYQLPNECKLELKALEPVYRDVRVIIPQLESSMSVEYDQFSTVNDVLRQVLNLSEPPLDPSLGYSLYHVRHRLFLDPAESMVHYHILPTDILECKLSIKKSQSVILVIKIPAIQSSRKVKATLDETVGELMSTLMRRVPDAESKQWTHMALYLHPRDPSHSGVWMEDYKFLAAYKLRSTDVIEFRSKYRVMVFELRVFPHDYQGVDNSAPYTSSELLIAQDTLVSEIIDLLCSSCALEYDPRYYGLFLHDDSMLPNDTSMWEHLDEHHHGYQDSIVLHMIFKPIRVSLKSEEEESHAALAVDFSQPCKILRDLLCRRYGVRDHEEYGLEYEGIVLNNSASLHNQGLLEEEEVKLVKLTRLPTTPTKPSVEKEGCNIWDEGPDTEQNIRFSKEKQCVVIGGTFNKLVERITASGEEHNMEFVKTFLLTYQSFTTPDELLSKLIERYHVVRPEGMPFKEFVIMRQTIQLRVINALKLWVELSVDFIDNKNLQTRVLMFVKTIASLDHSRQCKALRNNILTIKGVVQKKHLKTFRDPPPPIKYPTNPSPVLSVFDFDPEEIARQLSIIDFSLFAKIKPCELLDQAWQKEKYKHRAANILRLVGRMNNLTLWVATTILSQRDVRERAKRITDFVQISDHLRQMNNFCTLMSLLNGLDHPAIHRLKKTFGKVDKAVLKKLEDLQLLARPGDNFKLLRAEHNTASNPCIPYLGLYMSDLTFMDNGNPTYHPDGLINFSKCTLIYQHIRHLIMKQDKSYNFEEVPSLHESLLKFHFLDTDTLYDVSLQREPRD